ncbi:MAG TPA: hypothetical protein VGX78_11230 [Pirellulales bacterium]|nr:hypothetical protein [Pirellulales bacterium]
MLTIGKHVFKLSYPAAYQTRSGDEAAKSAILNRTRGAAKLTIFVKPAAEGSTVTIMTEGLDWEEEAP